MKIFDKATFKGMSKEECYLMGLYHNSAMFRDEFLEMDTKWGQKAAEHIENYIITVFGEKYSLNGEKLVDDEYAQDVFGGFRQNLHELSAGRAGDGHDTGHRVY